jgi:hypothetical protein
MTSEFEFYCHAVQFRSLRYAKHMYTRIQDYLRVTPQKEDCDISAYNLIHNDLPVCTVFGINVPDSIKKKVDDILSGGKPIILPQDVLAALIERRLEHIGKGNWQEYHYAQQGGVHIHPKGDS